MNTIWKFQLKLEDKQTIEIPTYAEILSVDIQNDIICLWAKVNPHMKREIKGIAIVGTGNPLPEGLKKFIGTVQQPPFVWHVFEFDI